MRADDWNLDPDCGRLIDPPGGNPLEELDLRTVPPLHRALLAIDGTVTRFLEAYALEPVEVIKLSHGHRRLPRDHGWLRAPAGTDVIARQVVLRGRDSTVLYAYAQSLLIWSRMPEPAQQELVHGDKGLGRIMDGHRMETYREILWSGRDRQYERPGAVGPLVGWKVVSRTYRVFTGAQPIMLIHEKFPTAQARS